MVAPVLQGQPKLEAIGQLAEPAILVAPGSALAQLDKISESVPTRTFGPDKPWVEILFHLPDDAQGYVVANGTYVKGVVMEHQFFPASLINVKSLQHPFAKDMVGMREEMILRIAIDQHLKTEYF